MTLRSPGVDGSEVLVMELGPEPQGSGMTYRVGVYVIDRRRNKLGRVMAQEGGCVQLRPRGGGVEWDCRPEDVRLATPQERMAGLGWEVEQ